MRSLNIEKIVDEFYDIIAYAHYHCCYYYILYYLVRVAGIKGLQSELDYEESKLARAFYYYGIYSVARELRHLDGKYLCPTEKWKPTEKFHLTLVCSHGDYARALRQAIKDGLIPPLSDREISNIATFMHRYYKIAERIFYLGKSKEEIVDFLSIIEREFHAFSKPKQFLQKAVIVFRAGELGINGYGWEKLYGGRTWAKIAETLLNKDRVSKTVFVDMCWAIQHNSEVWLDKVEKQWTYNELKELLTHKMQGRIKELFDYLQTSYSTALSIIRQYERDWPILSPAERAQVRRYVQKFESRLKMLERILSTVSRYRVILPNPLNLRQFINWQRRIYNMFRDIKIR